VGTESLVLAQEEWETYDGGGGSGGGVLSLQVSQVLRTCALIIAPSRELTGECEVVVSVEVVEDGFLHYLRVSDHVNRSPPFNDFDLTLRVSRSPCERIGKLRDEVERDGNGAEGILTTRYVFAWSREELRSNAGALKALPNAHLSRTYAASAALTRVWQFYCWVDM